MPPELHVLTPTCSRSFVRWGFAPDPTGGAYSAPPDSLAVFRDGRGVERRKEEGKGRGEGRKGEGMRKGGREFVLRKKRKVGAYENWAHQ